MFSRFREPVNTLTHMLGAVLAILGLIWIWIATFGDPASMVVGTIFSLGCILTFIASTVMHMYTGDKDVIRFLNKLDHSAIYLMIAGSYTPILYFGMDGLWRAAMLGAIWVMAIGGIIWKLWLWRQDGWASVLYYVSMGWVAIVAAPFVFFSLPLIANALMIIGGITYLAGAIVFATKRPNLNQWWGHHELWHMFVLAGCAFHYVAIVFFVL